MAERATVTATDPLTVQQFSSSKTIKAEKLAGYSPTVADVVWVDVSGSTPVVLGKAG